MIESLQALVLAIVQGLTEFLPISSSGHLILVPSLLGWADQGLAFDVAAHLGSLAAVCAYFRRDILALGRGWCAALVQRDVGARFPFADDRFDRVISALMLEHVQDLPALWRELARVTKPGGRLVLSAMHPAMFLLDSQAEFRDPASYEAMITKFDQVVGLEWLRVFHFNDSEKDLGSHVDRHTHIGEGCIGKEPFGYFLNDSRFQNTPFLLETPVKKDPDDNIRNLETLRSLIK